MRNYKIFWLLAVLMFAACAGDTAQKTAESPGATVRQYVEASKKQDIEAMKRLMSKDSLALMEKAARTQNTTVDEILRRGSAVQLKETPEMRNEKIEGDAASVEVKNENTGEFDIKLPFVKEDGAWKIAIDKYVAEIQRKATEDMNKPPANLPVENNSANKNQ